MKMLKSKLYQLEIEKQQEQLAEIRGEQKILDGEVKFVLTYSIRIR